LRRPVALVSADQGQWLLTANQRQGSISVIDTRSLQVVGEKTIGRQLADMVITPDGRLVLAADEVLNELIVLARQGKDLEVLRRVRLAGPPASLQTSADGKACFVGMAWSRRVILIDLSEKEGAGGKDGAAPASILLPFLPGKQCLLPGGTHLVVADRFAGRLAVVDIHQQKVASVRNLPAHNIRGLVVSGDGKDLLLVHQVLNPLGETTRDDIHWGNLITNNVRAIPLSAVLNPKADLIAESRLQQLGEVNRGAGDPAGLAVGQKGTQVVTLGGIDEVALGRTAECWQRLKVGRRPTAVALTPDDQTAFVANTFDDSISVIAVANGKVRQTLSLGAARDLKAVERGEILFFDARLSLEGWMSCHSCHTDGHTNGLLTDNLGDDSFGAPKRVLSLRGVADTAPYAWNGTMPDLETQIRKSIRTTMHGQPMKEDQVRDLTAYLRSLPSAPPQEPSHGPAYAKGRAIFENQACNRCHTPPTFTSDKTYDVGLKDEVGNSRFNPPSLRGVSQGGPYFHDNRAGTLAEVFTRYRHQLSRELTKTELEDLLSYLRAI
jgi:cytochrome c peroxidase